MNNLAGNFQNRFANFVFQLHYFFLEKIKLLLLIVQYLLLQIVAKQNYMNFRLTKCLLDHFVSSNKTFRTNTILAWGKHKRIVTHKPNLSCFFKEEKRIFSSLSKLINLFKNKIF